MKKMMTLLTMAALAAACTGKNTSNAQEASEAAALDVTPVEVATDSTRYDQTKDGIRVNIGVQWAAADGKALPKALATWMATLMDLDPDAITATDGKQLVRQLADAKYPELKEMTPAGPRSKTPRTQYDANVRIVLATADYVSYEGSVIWYVAGTAKPSQSHGGITLRRSDGQPVMTDLLTDTDNPKLRQLLREGMLRYLANEGIADNLDPNQLLGDQPFALPAMAPYLRPDGVAFAYGDYEVLPGTLPLIVIPYDQMQPYLK